MPIPKSMSAKSQTRISHASRALTGLPADLTPDLPRSQALGPASFGRNVARNFTSGRARAGHPSAADAAPSRPRGFASKSPVALPISLSEKLMSSFGAISRLNHVRRSQPGTSFRQWFASKRSIRRTMLSSVASSLTIGACRYTMPLWEPLDVKCSRSIKGTDGLCPAPHAREVASR